MMNAQFRFEGEGTLNTAEVIHHDAALWLVPAWLHSPDGRWKMPERIIPLASIPYEPTPGRQADFRCDVPIPKALFQTPLRRELVRQFQVREKPDIKFPLTEDRVKRRASNIGELGRRESRAVRCI
jgi:hypothetical protein